jgi:hypothetical protein
VTPSWMIRLYSKAPLRLIAHVIPGGWGDGGPWREYSIRLRCGHASTARLRNVKRTNAYGVPYEVAASSVDPATLPRQRCRTCCELMWPELMKDGEYLHAERIAAHRDRRYVLPVALPADVIAALEET